jgi:hypothetical protein
MLMGPRLLAGDYQVVRYRLKGRAKVKVLGRLKVRRREKAVHSLVLLGLGCRACFAWLGDNRFHRGASCSTLRTSRSLSCASLTRT